MSPESFNKESEDMSHRAGEFTRAARETAFKYLGKDANSAAHERVDNAVKNRFEPFIKEGMSINSQLITSKYQENAKEVINFLGCAVGMESCSDDRLSYRAFGAPLTVKIARNLAGNPDVMEDTRGDKKLADPNIEASIAYNMWDRRRKSLTPEAVQFLGPHANFKNPIEGCGALKAKLTREGLTADAAMKFGGIIDYFAELGQDGFYVFDKASREAGGQGSTFSMIHDAYTQGLTFGLGEKIFSTKKEDVFRDELTLQANLEELHNNKEILMTQMLVREYQPRILKIAQDMGIETPLDISNTNQFAHNVIAINNVAMELAKNCDFGFIPESLIKDKASTAARVLAYTAFRNLAYQIMGNIIPGDHSKIEHDASLVRAGEVGLPYNDQHVPLRIVTPKGYFRNKDIEAIKGAYGLLGHFLAERNVDLNKEGQLIVVTGSFNPSDYRDKDAAKRNYFEAAKLVEHNADLVRNVFSKGVQEGHTIVLPMLCESRGKPVKVL